MSTTRVVIVGAGVAGAYAAEHLAAAATTGAARLDIVLVGRELIPPYDRPPLSKQALVRGIGPVPLLTPDSERVMTFLPGRTAIALDPEARQVTVAGESAQEVLDYDHLVIATGSEPIRPAALDGGSALVLREAGDAATLRAAIEDHGAVTIVGAGFTGCEIASSARALGARATVIEALDAPLRAALGSVAGDLVAQLHRDNGVDLLTGRRASALTGDRLTLDDGGVIDGAPVVLALGARPDLSWLHSRALAQAAGGLACDASGRTSADRVWAAGDVAAWWEAANGIHRRHEHWTRASDQGRAVADGILASLRGESVPPADFPPPYFWSDQHKLKLQLLGTPSATDTVTALADPGTIKGTILAYAAPDGTLTAALGFGAPQVVQLAEALTRGIPAQDASALI